MQVLKAETAIFTAFDDHSSFDGSEPEKNLMRAILRTAMEDISKGGTAHRDARNYFLSREDNYLFSFASVCNHLNLCQRTILTLCGLLEEEKKKEESPSENKINHTLAA